DFGLIASFAEVFSNRSRVHPRCFEQHFDTLVSGLGPNLMHAFQSFKRVLDTLFAAFTDQLIVPDDLESNGLKHITLRSHGLARVGIGGLCPTVLMAWKK